MRTVRIFVLVALGALVAAACGDDDGASRDADGVIVEAGDLSVFDLREGDCWEAPDAGTTRVEKVRAVPCADAHDHEVFLAFDMPDGDYPGDAALDLEAGDRCLAGFEGFVDVDYFESQLDFFPVRPTEESWEQGDRTVYCTLFAVDLSRLTGSMRGTGR